MNIKLRKSLVRHLLGSIFVIWLYLSSYGVGDIINPPCELGTHLLAASGGFVVGAFSMWLLFRYA